MPSQFVKQPNGKLARFSTVVDDFTNINLSKSQALKLARQECAPGDAKLKVGRGIIDDVRGLGIQPRPDGLARWHECLSDIRSVHGANKVEEYKEQCE